ncbi:MAG: hypothetical protein WC710_14905 [Gallionella sp.]|jgi:hypothetical protein
MAIDPLTGAEKIIDSNAPPVTPPTSGLINAPQITATATTPATTAPTSTTPNAPVYGAPATQGWNVTDNQTVEGRVKGLIDANSPLMQQAATTGLQQSNARGLANSSMSVGASQAEVMKAAVPIATADANIHANAAQFNAIDPNKQMAIKADMDKFTAEIASRKDLSQAEIVARKDQLVTEIMSREGLAEKDRAATAARLDTELASRERVASLENDTRIKLAGDENKYKILIAQNQGASALYDTYQKAVNAINTSTMDAANKQKALDDQYAILQAGMAMYSDVEGLNIDGIINPPENSGVPGTPPGESLVAKQKAWDDAVAALGPKPPTSPRGTTPAMEAWQRKYDALGPRPA